MVSSYSSFILFPSGPLGLDVVHLLLPVGVHSHYSSSRHSVLEGADLDVGLLACPDMDALPMLLASWVDFSLVKETVSSLVPALKLYISANLFRHHLVPSTGEFDFSSFDGHEIPQ